jgi:hypothetical protein
MVAIGNLSRSALERPRDIPGVTGEITVLGLVELSVSASASRPGCGSESRDDDTTM